MRAPAATDWWRSDATPRSFRMLGGPAREKFAPSPPSVGRERRGTRTDETQRADSRSAVLSSARATPPDASSARRCTRSARIRRTNRESAGHESRACRRTAAGRDRGEQRADEAVNVKQGHHVEASIGGGEAERRGDIGAPKRRGSNASAGPSWGARSCPRCEGRGPRRRLGENRRTRELAANSSVKIPAASAVEGRRRITRMPSDSATAIAGRPSHPRRSAPLEKDRRGKIRTRCGDSWD